MRIVQILLVALVVVVAVAVALGWGDRLAAVSVDRAPAGLPPVPRLSPYDVAEVRFNLALRGYRMSEVDEVLSRLAVELADREDRLSALEAELAHLVATGGRADGAAARDASAVRRPAGSVRATLPAPGPDPLPPDPPPMPGPPLPDPQPAPRPPGPAPGPLPPGPQPPLEPPPLPGLQPAEHGTAVAGPPARDEAR